MKWDCFPLLNSKNFQYKPNFLSLVTKWNYENAEKNGRASYPNKVNWAPQAASLASASWMKSRRNHNNYWWIQAIKLIAIYLITIKKEPAHTWFDMISAIGCMVGNSAYQIDWRVFENREIQSTYWHPVLASLLLWFAIDTKKQS